MYRLKSINEIDPSIYDRVVKKSSGGWLLHTYDWITNILPKLSSFSNESFVIEDSGEILAVFPLYLYKYYGFNIATTSPMYAVGPIFTQKLPEKRKFKIAELINNYLKDFCRKKNVLLLKTRQNPFSGYAVTNETPLISYMDNTIKNNYSHILNLTPGLDSIRDNYEYRCRNSIKKSLKNECSVKVYKSGYSDMSDVLNNLYHRGSESKGRKADNRKKFFEIILNCNNLWVALGCKEEKILSFATIYVYKGKAYYSDAATIRTPDSIGLSNLLQHTIIEELISEKVTHYDMSHSYLLSPNKEQKMVSKFKQSFGAKLVPYEISLKYFYPALNNLQNYFGKFT